MRTLSVVSSLDLFLYTLIFVLSFARDLVSLGSFAFVLLVCCTFSGYS